MWPSVRLPECKEGVYFGVKTRDQPGEEDRQLPGYNSCLITSLFFPDCVNVQIFMIFIGLPESLCQMSCYLKEVVKNLYFIHVEEHSKQMQSCKLTKITKFLSQVNKYK